ncbi:MAG: hypothetical protein ACE5Z5_08580 [Candidatus Bathyarchaeia archaeon]
MKTLFDVETNDDVSTKGYKNALSFVVETVDKIVSGEIPIKQLDVSKILRKPLAAFSVASPSDWPWLYGTINLYD